MPFPFTHLHTHSHYSLLGAVPKIKALVERAKKDGMHSLALTDNGNMYGAIEFYDVCTKNDIKPILGIDAYLASRTRFDKERENDLMRHRIVLLAENNVGYKNLIRLVTASYTEGFFFRPRLDKELLLKYREGIIALLPAHGGEHLSSIQGTDEEKTSHILLEYKDIFGEKNTFLEITMHPELEGHSYLMEKVKEIGKKTGIQCVASHNIFYLEPQDREAREVMLKIQNDTTPEEEGFFEDEDFSFIDTKEAQKRFKNDSLLLQNTEDIAQRCHISIELGKWYFPDLPILSGRTPEAELEFLAKEGVEWRGMKYEGKVKERLDYELSVIQTKGYSVYFLAVADLLREARERKILTTIRGSVAGSLVTYATGITNVNPLKLNLPFERFLNPHRPSAPDIDMDFADNRRDEIIAYAKEKYGKENVAQIGTFGTMMARAAVRDVARALGYSYGIGDKIAKAIPFGSQGFPMTISHALKTEKEFLSLYKKDPDTKKIVDLAKKIEGCARHVGVHAAGVVIAPEPLENFVPIQPDPKGTGKYITQYDMHGVGEDGIGLLKFDFLGLKNLAIIANALLLVKEKKGKDIDIEKIPLDDRKTFEMLARGETGGVFQLNGTAMTHYLKELRPNRIEDINAMIALYRPGPMKNIPEYIARKQGRSPIKYFHPKAEDFLGPSYGILVYQDDLLFTALELAGYNWETVDKFRKAVGKKIPEEMAKQHVIFVEGCQKYSGMSKKDAEAIWDLFEPFQGYGFNKAHAASYGLVAYQTAYMKANYPQEYMTAILTADSKDIDKVSEGISECVRLDVPVLPPDVNESFETFTCVEHKGKECIRFGLNSIKNFGDAVAHHIIEEREKRGKFTSLENFLSRISERSFNKKSLEALIKCGALDCFHYSRGKLLANCEALLLFQREKREEQKQVSLFITKEVLTLKDANDPPKQTILEWEKEHLGLYVSGHPLDEHKERIEKLGTTIRSAKEMYCGKDTILAGLLTTVKPFTTKKGDKMAFITLSDKEDSIEGVIFPKTYEEKRDIIIPNKCVALKGKVTERNGERSFVVDKLRAL